VGKDNTRKPKPEDIGFRLGPGLMPSVVADPEIVISLLTTDDMGWRWNEQCSANKSTSAASNYVSRLN